MREAACCALGLALGLGLASGASAVAVEGELAPHMEAAELGGVPVLLLGVLRGGDTVEQETRTAADGSFAFRDLPQPAVYLVMATFDGVRFPGGRAVFEGGPEDAVERLAIPIFAVTSEREALRLTQVRLRIERHAGGWYRAEQAVGLRNDGNRVVVREEGASPLLEVGLLSGHGEVSSPFGELPTGFEVETGRLRLVGPVLPGSREVSVGYEVESRDGRLESELVFPDETSELELFVRDSGLVIEGDALHPARPVRDSQGLAYQRYLAFELERGSRVSLRIRPLPSSAPGDGRLATALGASALTLVLSLLVARPVMRGARASAPQEPEPALEREALAAALAELEHDFETGKLSEPDRDRLREDLKREALQALARSEPVASRADPTGS